MASTSPSMDVEEEVKCPICMEYLADPVTLDCGHNYRRGCITHYCETWEELDQLLECPLCKARIKKGHFRPNWQLANIADKIKGLSLFSQTGDLCVKHKEKLNLFCKEDQELVCLICERSSAHQSHTILLLGEAAQEYKIQIPSYLEVLRKERERILANKAETEKESQDLLRQIEAEKINAASGFNQLCQFLEEQKMLFLFQMEELEQEIARKREDHTARLLEELYSLESLIQQMEEKCRQPARELLQDVGDTLQRCEKRKMFESPAAFPSELKLRSWESSALNPYLEPVIKHLKDALLLGLQWQKANVTLDPDTAHPLLILSEDGKSVRKGPRRQDLPDNPKRFDFWSFVLGREGFTTGRHFWEVTVGSEGNWAVGVARKSVRRKGYFDISPEGGIWAVGKWEGKYCLPKYPSPCPLPLSGEPKRIKVSLNVDARRVAFFDADTEALLATYPEASLSGETLLPFFQVLGEGCLTLPP